MFIIRCLSLITCLVVLFTSCENPHPGFKRTAEDIYFRLLMVGNNDRCCQFDDYVTVHISYSDLNDSIFFKGLRKFQVRQPDFLGSIDRCLTMICVGDSAQFIISAVDFFEKTLESEMPDFLRKEGKMKISVKLLNVQTPEEYRFEQIAFLHWVEDLGEYEKLLLNQFIRNENISMPPTENGMYFVEQQPGEGPLIVVGDTITIHYEGYFLNGNFFDSTRHRNEPLQFVYGQQWQVVPGIEMALGMMRDGGKSLVIMPSELAFGIEGSVLNIVPPYTSVIFEIELINVKR